MYFVVLCKHRSTVCVQDQIVGSGCLMRRCCCCVPGLRTFWKRWKQSAAWPIYTVPLRELNRLRGVNAAVVYSISSALKKVLCGSSHRLSGFYVDLILQFDFKSRTLFCLFDFNLSLSWNRCKKMVVFIRQKESKCRQEASWWGFMLPRLVGMEWCALHYSRISVLTILYAVNVV